MLLINMDKTEISKFTVLIKCSKTDRKFTVEILQNINTDKKYISEHAKAIVRKSMDISNCEVISDYFKPQPISNIDVERKSEVKINGKPISPEIIKRVYV